MSERTTAEIVTRCPICGHQFGIPNAAERSNIALVNALRHEHSGVALAACLEAAERIEKLETALIRAREAIRLTREYVDPGCYGPQPSLLPPMEGWSWYDAVVMIDEILGDTSEWAGR